MVTPFLSVLPCAAVEVRKASCVRGKPLALDGMRLRAFPREGLLERLEAEEAFRAKLLLALPPEVHGRTGRGVELAERVLQELAHVGAVGALESRRTFAEPGGGDDKILL